MDITTFFSLSYGLYIVTSEHEGKKLGYVANTVFQVTADPPRLAISCHKDNLSFEGIRARGAFNISVFQKYASAQIIQLFGYQTGKEVDKFEKVLMKKGSNELPVIIQDCMAWFECRIVQEWDVGTHVVFVGEVEEAQYINQYMDPLTYDYYRENKKAFSPKNSPTYIDPALLPQKKKAGEEKGWQLYVCPACGYVYDPEAGDEDSGIPAGTRFEDLPDDWECPVCGVTKKGFMPLD